jgi:hypothetical protein
MNIDLLQGTGELCKSGIYGMLQLHPAGYVFFVE